MNARHFEGGGGGTIANQCMSPLKSYSQDKTSEEDTP